MAQLSLHDVIKRYGDLEVIKNINLDIESGEFCVFVGPSGCGKSTLLRMIAGLEDISQGQISIKGQDMTHIDAADRGVAMVFQNYALYPHMSVAENIGFGLRMNGVAKQEIKKRVDDVAGILKLQEYLKRKPKALSGGQRQRVAIGRALIRDPDVFLFDEPLSNLDAELRGDMRIEIARLHKEIGATMIYVTHDQVEAMTLADKIVVLRAGKIEQIGAPMELYDNPSNKFVAGFIGSPAMNFMRLSHDNGKANIAALGGDITLPNHDNKNIWVGIRPEHLKINSNGKGLKVDIVERLGGVSYICAIAENQTRFIIEHKSTDVPKSGDDIGIEYDHKHLYFFDVDSEARIRH